MNARELIEAEDPKQFMVNSRDDRYKKQLLAAFINDVEELLGEADAGNGETWPPPEGFQGDHAEHNFSRWNHVWNELEKVKQAYRVFD